MGQLVNKQELAKCLGVSPTSISLWMLRYGDDFPAAERDPERRRYRFDPAEVAAFLRARQDQEAAGRAAAEAAHAALLASAPRLFAPSAAGADAEGSRLKVEMDAWRLRRLQREEAERIGALLPVEQVGALLCDVFSRLGRDLHASIRRIGREQDWPDTYVRQIEARAAAMQHATVAELRAMLAEGEPSAAA